ncbi:hypothetical protein ACFYYS_19990 [Streptomyces sp. NPDC002120]|uniref:hypothetical protein n=1 Tax=Streptomyces sp. NPDC002120 TaxID=3364631 RepID=UPI0036B7CD57
MPVLQFSLDIEDPADGDLRCGRELGSHTTGTAGPDHLRLLAWARRFGDDRTWAVEDCRQLSRRLEADLLAAGERIVRVPPKLMAHCRTAARTYRNSDPIDARSAARAALREPDVPTARLDDASRDVRLLMDHPTTWSPNAPA